MENVSEMLLGCMMGEDENLGEVVMGFDGEVENFLKGEGGGKKKRGGWGLWV